MIQKKRKYEEKNEGAHMWATVRWSGKNAISPQRILLHPVTRPPVGTYGTLGRFVSLPSTPRVSVGSSPFDDCQLLEAS